MKINILFPNKNLNDDQKIAILLATLLGYSIIIHFINLLVNFVLPNTPIDTLIGYGIVAFIIMATCDSVWNRLDINDLIFLMIFMIAFILSALFFPKNYEYIIETAPRFFFTVFPFYLIGRAIRDYDVMIGYLKMISKWVIIAAVGCYILILNMGIEVGQYDMDFAYKLLPSVLIIFYASLSERKAANWLFAILGISVIVLAGTRGPLLCIAAFFVLWLLSNFKGKSIAILLLASILGVYMYISKMYIKLILELNLFLSSKGIYNRIFDMFLSGEISDSSERDIIFNTVINAIQNNPLTGLGIMGDRVVLNGLYTHNLFLEILCQYGVLLGSALLIALFYVLLRKLFITQNSHEKFFVEILFCLGIVKTMMSGSYVFEPLLFLLIGICINNKLIDTSPKMYLDDKG